MAFDDLARHMASRDGAKRSAPASAEQIVAEAAEAARKMSRTRDLILGPILLVGGAIILTLLALYLIDAINPTPNPLRPPETGNRFLVPTGGIFFAGAMVIVGLQQAIRGLRGRSQ